MIEALLATDPRWDAIVRTFTDYDVYYLSGYVKGFQMHGDGEPLLVYYEDGVCRGINVVMKRDISGNGRFQGEIDNCKYYDLATPYGYGGWLIENKGKGENVDFSGLFQAYEMWCQENHIVSEFVRYHPLLTNYRYGNNFYNIVPLGNTVSLELVSPDDVWNNFTTQCRGRIRKAKRSGIQIYRGLCPEIFHTYMEIYNSTMDNDMAEQYYYFGKDFYESIMKDLPYNAQIFYAVLDEKVIAASIILAANGRLTYHLGGSLREYQNLAPNNLLHYEAALWGYENGCRSYHLGGGVGAREDSLYRFKKTFYRGMPHPYCIGKRIHNREMYNRLCRLRKIEPRGESGEGYFPEYRGDPEG